MPNHRVRANTNVGVFEEVLITFLNVLVNFLFKKYVLFSPVNILAISFYKICP